MKEKFKLGDKVYLINYGWGEIIELLSADEFVKIKFKNDTHSFIGFDLVSFTEYTLEGFSQERVELPEVGELCLVRDYDDQYWRGVKFKTYDKTLTFPFIDSNDDGWKQIKRIKILD